MWNVVSVKFVTRCFKNGVAVWLNFLVELVKHFKVLLERNYQFGTVAVVAESGWHI